MLLGLVVMGMFLLALFVTRVAFPLRHLDAICTAAADHGVSPHLVAAVVREESRFRTEAVSPRGARGLMQLMPDTAEWVASEMGLDFVLEDLHDPAINVDMGTWYLSHLLDRFDSVPLAVAAYNGGMARVSGWIRDGIWSGCPEEVDRIPAEETREFVRRVLNSHRVYRWLYGGITD